MSEPGIPNQSQIERIFEETNIPLHIRQHSEVVSNVAVLIGDALCKVGYRFDLPLIDTSAQLHDIGKARALKTREDHGKLGAQMITAAGFPRLAPIIENHVVLDHFDEDQQVSESLIVNYADKRVKHTEIVSLSERFEDLVERYARNDKARDYLTKMLNTYYVLENKIFAPLPFSPDELE